MAGVTHSFVERYDMEFERLGDVKSHIRPLYPPNPKIMPWQLERMVKTITDREVLGGPGLQETVRGRRVWLVWASMLGRGGERNLADCPTVCARARQTERRTSFVNSFLISRSLSRGIFIQKRPLPIVMDLSDN